MTCWSSGTTSSFSKKIPRRRRETSGARHVFSSKDGEALFTVTERDVFVRRSHVATGGVEWDAPIGRNKPGEVYTPYAAAMFEPLIAVGVYDRHIELVDGRREQVALARMCEQALGLRERRGERLLHQRMTAALDADVG